MNPGLTPTEREYLRLRALGLTNGEVAELRHVSSQTVKNVLTTAYRRLDVQRFADALREVGWLKVPPR